MTTSTKGVATGAPAQPSQSLEFGGVAGNALRNLLHLLFKRLYLGLSVFAFCILAAIAYMLLATPTYRAVALIEVFRDTSDQPTVTSSEQRPVVAVDTEFYETQYGLLRSQATARAVVRKLRLKDNKDFFPDGETKVGSASELVAQEIALTEKLQKNLQIVPGRQSRLVEIRYLDPNAKLAAAISNAVTDSYIQANFDRRVQRSEYARTFLAKRIDDLRLRLEEQERRLIEYAADAQIVSLPSSRTSEQGDGATQTAGQSLAGSELQALSDELAKARADHAASAGRLQALRAAGGKASPEILSNNAVNGLQQQRAMVSSEIARMSVLFDDDYPPLASKRAELQQIDNQISGLSAQIFRSVQTEAEGASARERSLEARVDDLKAQLIGVTRSSVGYNILQREVDTSRVQYDSLLQRLKQLSVENDIGASNVAIIQRADAPLKPFAPNKQQILVIGLLLGLALMCVAAVAAELLDTSIASPESIKSRFAEPLIGVLPPAKIEDTIGLLTDPKAALTEAYVSMIANLRFSTTEGAPRTISVTSSKPSEGKSTTSIALATLFARQGDRVLLIDADLRKPSLHKKLELPNKEGFSNLLTGDKDFQRLLVNVDRVPGLQVLTSGPMPPNPAELVSGGKLVELMRELGEHFDRVIVDCPPVLGLADAPLLARSTEGTVFVVAAGSTRFGETSRALERIQSTGAHIVGIALSKFAPRTSRFDEYGYGSDSYYTYKSSETD